MQWSPPPPGLAGRGGRAARAGGNPVGRLFAFALVDRQHAADTSPEMDKVTGVERKGRQPSPRSARASAFLFEIEMRHGPGARRFQAGRRMAV